MVQKKLSIKRTPRGYTPAILPLTRVRQEDDHVFTASLDYIESSRPTRATVRTCLEKERGNKGGRWKSSQRSLNALCNSALISDQRLIKGGIFSCPPGARRSNARGSQVGHLSQQRVYWEVDTSCVTYLTWVLKSKPTLVTASPGRERQLPSSTFRCF